MSDRTFIPLTEPSAGLEALAAGRVRGARFSVEIHCNLGAVEAGWHALERAGCCTVFQRFETFAAWTRHIAPAHAISWHVVTVRDRRTGRWVMILPLCLREQDGLRIIEGADLEVSDFIAPILHQDFYPSTAEMRRVWSRVRRLLPPADVIRLSKMPGMLGAMPNPLLRIGNVRPFRMSNFKTRLDGESPSWMERMPAKVRDDLAARRRKLSKRGKLQFKTAATSEEAQRFFDAMVMQRAERCRAMGRENILELAGYSAFYRDLVRPETANSIGSMQVMLLDDEIIATGFGLRHRGDFLMIFPTFVSEKWRNYSPGLQFFMESMNWAAGQGLSSYDFTIGAESFKRDFAADSMPLYEHLSAASWRGWPVVLEGAIRRRARRVRDFVRRRLFGPGNSAQRFGRN